jgi:phosphoglycerate dehydrogenase-like enzyme
MNIVFHGENAACFSKGFADLVGPEAKIVLLPDVLASEAEREAYAEAQAIIGVKFDASLPKPLNLKLFHVPGAGYDAVDLAALPASATVCNCFGHEQPIAEYVMTAILNHHIPMIDADRRLRQGDWRWWAGSTDRLHGEIANQTIGLLGFGHIGKAIARRAKAFDMRVSVANRSPVVLPDMVDQSYTLDRIEEFWGGADYIVVSVPFTPETRGLVDATAFAKMRPHALVLNVGRGPTIDEQALYNALKNNVIGGAVIDTWYRYPSAAAPHPQPSGLPFSELGNIVMTSHMSGWTHGTIRRRQQVIARNVRRRMAGEPCENVVRNGTNTEI